MPACLVSSNIHIENKIFDDDEEIIDFRADPQMIEVIDLFY